MRRMRLSIMAGMGLVLLLAVLPSLVAVQPAGAAQEQDTIIVISSQSTSQQGQSVTFTAYVCDNTDPYPYATGSVTFMDGSTSLGSVPLAGGPFSIGCPTYGTDNGLLKGEATLTTSSLSYGVHQISVTYPGDSNFAGGTSNTVTQNIQPGSSSSALTASPNPSQASCTNDSLFPITLTFTVPQVTGRPVPTGLVTFSGGSTSSGLPQSRSVGSNGVATITFNSPPGSAGSGGFSSTFMGAYSGDSNYPAFSASVTQVLTDVTNISLSSSVNPSSPGQGVTFTANVSADCAGGPTPTGSVTFFDSGGPLATVGLGNSAIATDTTTALPAGTQKITASYSGDGNYLAGSKSLLQTVAPPVTNGNLPAPVVGMASLPNGFGYWLADAQGGVSAHGAAVNYGSMAGQPLNASISHIVSTPDGLGYWLVAADGGTFAFGDAGFYGSMGGKHLNAPVVDVAPTQDGKGYWLVASDGGIFAFGDAGFLGSMGGQPLNRPVVGITADYATGGYWEVATDGGIFAFGAPFYGSTGNIALDKPVNGMAATSDGQGYWFVASDGGIFAFGDAQFYGSAVGQSPNAAIVGMATDNATGGYWLVASNGTVFHGNAPNYGVD